MAKLEGKVAVVTGASKGIGAAIARSLAREGAAVVVNYASSRAGAEAVVADITAGGGRAVAVQADVAQAAQARELIEAALAAFGRLDVLVNNSGVYEFAAIGEVTEAHYRRLFDVNVLGVLLATQAAEPHLGAGASIVNISSAAVSVLPPTSAVYTGTKGAVNAISGCSAKELAPRGIRSTWSVPATWSRRARTRPASSARRWRPAWSPRPRSAAPDARTTSPTSWPSSHPTTPAG